MLRYGGEFLNLISKKDLLAITGISYGQLYRWKRERLIPEEWFIKQSSYTGQETFFPREQVLSRINSILELKDSYSLEELAKLLSPETSVTQISINALRDITEINSELLKILPEVFKREQFEIFEVALIVGLSQVVEKESISNELSKSLLSRMISPAIAKKNTNVLCTIFRLEEEYHAAFSVNSVAVSFDDDIEAIDQINLREISDLIKLKYKNLFMK